MIAVERRGQLGNQIFQFAFGLAAAARLGTDFVMDETELRGVFVLESRGGAIRRAARAARYRADRRLRPYPIVKFRNDSFDEPEEVLTQLADRTQYAGFFQSERFFDTAAARVRSALAFRPEHVHTFRERYGDLLAAPYVVCHVRRYLDMQVPAGLPVSYYREALERCAPVDLPVVFVGDDLSEVELAFPHARFERNDPVLDLQLLVNAATAVVSNSTFAWWGGWLGDPGRQVVAPRHWLGFREGREYPPRVVPERWTQLDV